MNRKIDKTYNILFCGTGGQGVLTAAEICGIAAMGAGYQVKKSEVHGMAQRGGSVESHLRFGAKIFSPLLQPAEADYIVCFHADEGKRLDFYLKKGGINFLRFLGDPQYQPSDERFLNTYFLGLLSTFLPLTEETWLAALNKQMKQMREENETAFLAGHEAGKKVSET
jgi:indolepyruvate ferredoxin oxidoreductase beta subunit